MTPCLFYRKFRRMYSVFLRHKCKFIHRKGVKRGFLWISLAECTNQGCFRPFFAR